MCSKAASTSCLSKIAPFGIRLAPARLTWGVWHSSGIQTNRKLPRGVELFHRWSMTTNLVEDLALHQTWDGYVPVPTIRRTEWPISGTLITFQKRAPASIHGRIAGCSPSRNACCCISKSLIYFHKIDFASLIWGSCLVSKGASTRFLLCVMYGVLGVVLLKKLQS